MSCLLLKSIGKQLKSNSPFYKPCSFILITLLHNKKWMYSERTGYYPYFGSTKSCARNMNALKGHAELQRKYEASLQEYSRQVEEISACTAVIADLRWKLADLTRRLWGKSSEKRHLPKMPAS